MTNGANPLPEDFFRTRPERHELHRFLTDIRTGGDIPVLESAAAEAASAELPQQVTSVEKPVAVLHIPHQPVASPSKKTEPKVFLHIPHRITASRLSRRVHLTESGNDDTAIAPTLLAEPVRQIKVHQAAAIPLSIPPLAKRKAATRIIPALAVSFPAGGVCRKMATVLQIPLTKLQKIPGKQLQLPISVAKAKKKIHRIKSRQSSISHVLEVPVRISRQLAVAAEIPLTERKLPIVRTHAPLSILSIKRLSPRVRQMPRHFLPSGASAGKGQLYRSLNLPVVSSRRTKPISKKSFSALVLPVVEKHSAKDIGKGMMVSAPITTQPKRTGRKTRMPLLKANLITYRTSGVRRVTPILLPATVKQPIGTQKMTASAIRRVSRIQEKIRIPVISQMPARQAQLPITKYVLAEPVDLEAKRRAEARRERSRAAFQEIIDATRLRVKLLPKFRAPQPKKSIFQAFAKPAQTLPKAVPPISKPTLPPPPVAKPVVAITSTPHEHQAPISKRFTLPRPTVSLPRPQFSLPKRKERPAADASINKKKRSGIFGEVARFAVTSAAIFAISFSVMNAPALSQLLMARINTEELAVKEIALEKVTDTETKELAPILPTAGMKRESHKVYPALSIKLAPLENRIIIPKIGKNIPVVGVSGDSLLKSDWNQLEKDIQNALKDGVVHYPGTAEPGQMGNVFITGHSSYYLWDKGGFKDVFARLHDLDVGDEFTIFWEQNVYRYKIRERKVVPPEETSVLKQPTDEKIATLMTCTPIGTAKNRLILVAEQL